MSKPKSKRYLGIQVDDELRVLIRTKLAEKDITMHEAVLRGLGKELDIDMEPYLRANRPTRIAL